MPGWRWGCLLLILFTCISRIDAQSDNIRSGMLIGTVLSSLGIPVSEAVVSAFPVEQVRSTGERGRLPKMLDARTDRYGTFRLVLPFGRYWVQVSAPGFQVLFYEQAASIDEAMGVVLDTENPEVVWPVVLTPEVVLSGQVLDKQTGQALTGGFVVAEKQNQRPAFYKRVPIQKGVYVLEGLVAGTYHIQAFVGGYVTGSYDHPVVVVAGDVLTGVDISLSQGLSLTGRVTTSEGKPLKGFEVVAEWAGSAQETEGESKLPRVFRGVVVDAEKGTYRISGLPKGIYRVRASARNYVSVWYAQTEDVEQAQPVEVALDAAIEGIDFSLTPGGQLTGMVTSDGRPITNARVTVRRTQTPGSWQTASGRNGVFAIGGLPSGQYLIRVEGQGYVGEFYEDAKSAESARLVDVAIGTDPVVIHMDLAERHPADFDSDGAINFADLLLLCQRLAGKEHAGVAFDLNRDAQIDFLDFTTFVEMMHRAGKIAPGTGSVFWRQLPGSFDELVAVLHGEQWPMGQGYVVRLTYHPEEGTFLGAELDEVSAFAGRHVQVVESTGSVLVLVGSPDENLCDGNGPLVRLRFRHSGQVDGLMLTTQTGLLMGIGDGFVPVRLPDPVLLEVPPQAFRLKQNVPNPFNPFTSIAFELPEEAEVNLAIYNLVGQRVRSLVHERRSAGRYMVEWDGRDDLGRDVSSGVYFYRLQANHFLMTHRMLLVR